MSAEPAVQVFVIEDNPADVDLIKEMLSDSSLRCEVSSTSSVTRRLLGIGPVRARTPDIFRDFVIRYLETFVAKRPKPRKKMEALATLIGDLGAGLRNLVDVHAVAVERSLQATLAQRGGELAIDGRLFALEIMGSLVDYYRLGVRRHRGDPDAD